MSYLRVLWRDATSVDAWTSRSDLYLECNIIETVGHFVQEAKGVLTLALSYDQDSDSFSNYINIPTKWIAGKEELLVKGKKRK